MKQLIVIYDSILNSVFQGQVLEPILKKLNAGDITSARIFSFESKIIPTKEILKLIPDSRIQVTLLKKTIFLGSISLLYASHKLAQAIRNQHFDLVLCRGPLAGYIAIQSGTLYASTITIQARGLCEQEYRYEHETCSILLKPIHNFRANKYRAIEQQVYGALAQKNTVHITAVSSALKDYLVHEFKAPKKKIQIEQADVPKSIEKQKKEALRAEKRKNLQIKSTDFVYVYNGSAKSWQCPEQTVSYFAQQYKKDSNSFLLLLSQDSAIFESICAKHALPKSRYMIKSVSHKDIYSYLAAADAGIIFRKAHVINWVSRPTKILEYQAVGLEIIHNNTVGILCD